MKKYISDLHFGHEKVIEFDNRPFTSVNQMDEELIKRWNLTTNKKDDVYIIGDFAFHNEKEYSWYLSKLNGKKHLVLGNHDYRLLKDDKAQSYFETIHHILNITDDNREIVLCHYPMLEWKGYFRGSLHIFGHIHESCHDGYEFICKNPNMLNAGASIIDYHPVGLKELIVYNMEYKLRLQQALMDKRKIEK